MEELGRNQPDSIAFTRNSANYTFSAVDGLANHVAQELSGQIPGGKALIAVWSKDPAMQLILTFGVWKAGMLALILDVRDSENRLGWVVNHAGVDAVIADGGSVQQASQVAAEVMVGAAANATTGRLHGSVPGTQQGDGVILIPVTRSKSPSNNSIAGVE